MKWILFRVVLAGILVGEGPSAAAEERLHHIQASVRVIYSVSGESAVPTVDSDDDGVPDRVEDIALQVWAAREFFCGHLGYPDPLESARFGEVDCIQISILSKEKINGLNGVAYRRAQSAAPMEHGKVGDRALILAVANTVDPKRNPTPAHEFFHLIQYGATYFSNGWFLEGMARWSEASWRQSGSPATSLARPTDWTLEDENTEKLFGMRYDAAAAFWNPLAIAFEEKIGNSLGRKNLPESLQSLIYADGTPVLQGRNLSGAALMRDVLEEMSSVQDRASKGSDVREWSLARQGAPENNTFLFEAVREVLQQHGMIGK